jgi:AraC family transcriptional regulator
MPISNEGVGMNWQGRMEAALDYLEENLEGEIVYSRAAAEANCSTFHFLRMFEVVSGVTVGEYVRRRRMSIAALKLSENDIKISDLALSLGYESPDAFARAFKREFDVTPSEARAGGVRLRSWPRFSFSIVLKGDIAMEFRIEQHKEFSITGVGRKFSTIDDENFREIPQFWKSIAEQGQLQVFERALPQNPKLGILGICVNDYDDKENTFTYLIGIESPEDTELRATLPEGSVDIMVQELTWAIFSSRGPLPGAIQDVFKRIFAEWFPTSGYEHADGPELEVYGPGDMTAEDYYCEVWIPVKKA